MKWSHSEPVHSAQVEDLVNRVAHAILEQIQDRVPESRVATFDECRRTYDPPQLDNDDIFDLGIEDQLQLIEQHARRLDVTIPDTQPGTLRAAIETAACHIIVRLAEQRAMNLFEELEVFMARHELEVLDMLPDNPLAHLPHQIERRLGKHCVAYGYRAPDGSIAEVLEFRLAGIPFYFERIRR
jgi:hypothetical protein